MARRLQAPAQVALLASLLACGGEKEPDFRVHGVAVVLDTPAPFAHSADLPARLESTIGGALQYWGGDWSALEGRTVTLEGASHVACSGNTSALGCYDGNIRITTSDPSAGTFDCVEQTVLVHEIGHAVIGDRMHEDPRWMEFDALGAELSGRMGYGADGEVGCVIYTSVWRHPLGTP